MSDQETATVEVAAEIKELGDKLPYGPEKINALNSVDWTVINPKRGEWTKMWARRIEN